MSIFNTVSFMKYGKLKDIDTSNFDTSSCRLKNLIFGLTEFTIDYKLVSLQVWKDAFYFNFVGLI